MKALCFFFLLLSFAYSQKLAKDRKASPNLGPWIKGQCQRPTSGKCSKVLSCCPSFTGVKIWTRSCHGIGCDEAKLVKEFGCLYKCLKEASWAHWISQGCTPSCGKRKQATETFKRYCIDKKGNVVNDNFCPGISSKTVRCKQDLPPCGKWTSWTAGECSTTCGKGTHKLTRECPKKNICFGDTIKYEDCQVQECGVWSQWLTGQCSASCGGGVLKSVRVCSSACEGDAEKVEACNTAPCRSGSWSVWMQSSCDKSCGGGTRTILRRCSIPEACEGSEKIAEECNTDVCETGCMGFGGMQVYLHNAYGYITRCSNHACGPSVGNRHPDALSVESSPSRYGSSEWTLVPMGGKCALKADNGMYATLCSGCMGRPFDKNANDHGVFLHHGDSSYQIALWSMGRNGENRYTFRASHGGYLGACSGCVLGSRSRNMALTHSRGLFENSIWIITPLGGTN